MNAEPLVDGDFGEWDAFAARSLDAWFWQTTAWMRYTKEYAGTAFRENLSFWVANGKERLAIVPCFHEHGPSTLSLYHDQQRGAAIPRLSYAGVPLPMPALHPELGSEKRWEILEFVVERLREIARDRGVERFTLLVPPLAPRYTSGGLPQANPLSRLGALDLTRATQVIDLRPDLAKLWSEVRHGHQYDVRKGEKSLQVRIWRGPELRDETFEEYRRVHAKDAGRVTRGPATWELMRGWVRDGSAALAEVTDGKRSLGFILLFLYGSGALYASACRDPEEMKLPVFHVAQWAVIQWLKAQGFGFYDIGIQQFGPQWFDSPSPKHLGIAKFKRGFGGVTVPVYTGEFCGGPAGLRRAVSERLDIHLPEEAHPA